MNSYLKLSAALLLLAPAACSDPDITPVPENGGAGSGGTGGGSSGLAGTGGTGGTGGDSTGLGGSSGSEGGTDNLPLAGSSGTGATPDAGVARSTLPVPATTGVPRPAGSADGLTVLDWAGFQAAVTYTFDDANTSQIQNYDALQALGVPFTFYIWTNMSGAMSDVWDRALADGHELGNHTQTHQMGTSPNIAADTDAATQYLEDRFGIVVRTMAAPYGHTQYIDVARSRFLINRGVGGGQIAPNSATDPLNLPTFTPPADSLASAFNSRVDTARAAGSWETVLVHGFTGGGDGAYQPVALSEFEAAVNYAKSFDDVWIGTMLDVGSYWIAQKLLTDTTPTTAGGVSTWQWTLPDHFPPGQFVRVTVNGGTLAQNGVELAWDEHGYYEVALDAGSLTLAP